MKEKQNHIQFQNTIAPYLNSWDDWIYSDYCFLSEQEITIASLYLNTGCISLTATKQKRSYQSISRKISRIKRKLFFGTDMFLNWEKNKPEDSSYPLHVPIPCLKTDVRLKNLLNRIGNSLFEILNEFTIDDLYKMNGWGKQTVACLENLLDKYGYKNLLRKKNRKCFKPAKNCLDECQSPPGDKLKPLDLLEKCLGVMQPIVEKAGENKRPCPDFLLPVSVNEPVFETNQLKSGRRKV